MATAYEQVNRILRSPSGRKLRSLRRRARTAYLQRRYPHGHYLRCNGVDVFCDFRNPLYQWYDTKAPHLAFESRLVGRLCQESQGSIFIDVGAHYGYISAQLCRYLAIHRRESRLIALEPDVEHFQCLEKTMGRYSTALTDVVLLQAALADTDRTLTMYRSAGPCLHSYGGAQSQTAYSVEALSLDSLADQQVPPGERIAFVKVDVEGAEPDLFKGGTRCLSAHEPIIMIEYYPAGLVSYGVDPYEFLESLCAEYFVQLVSYRSLTLRRLPRPSRALLAREVGDGMADMILSKRELDLSTVSSA